MYKHVGGNQDAMGLGREGKEAEGEKRAGTNLWSRLSQRSIHTGGDATLNYWEVFRGRGAQWYESI